MDNLLKILEILPSIEFIETFLHENPLELNVTKQFYEIINTFAVNQRQFDEQMLNDTYIMIDAIKDHLWEVINTGHFSQVNKMDRQLFTLASLQKAVLLLIKAYHNLVDEADAREKSMWELDNGLLLGCPLPHSTHCNVLSDCLTILQSVKCIEMDGTSGILNLKSDVRLPNENCDVDVLDQPSIDHFRENYFNKNRPGILKNCMTQWPAMKKWHQPNYLVEMCRNRIVPIEIGKNYTNENWSQDLVKFEDFFRRQFLANETTTETTKRIEYLAQHNLFDQIPALKGDILTPEYCCCCTSDKSVNDEIDVDIKAWLGPQGTTSPMHIDEKHNLLCQVFGSKRIILAAPSDTIHLYPFDGDMLKNTSQIDAEHPDYNRFPLLRHVTFYTFTLHTGEMLYIPPKWWHFVRSLSKSFSVSFWWQ